MLRKIVTLAIAASYILQISCATTRHHTITQYDAEKYMKDDLITIVLHDGTRYRLINFRITETYIVGDVVRRDWSWQSFKIVEKDKKISFEEIDYVEVVEKNDTLTYIAIGCLAAVGIAVIVLAIVCGGSSD